MYLDKLYNKLFSENNLEGIEVLNREIRLFTEAADPSAKLKQLLDTIRIKQSKGEDASAEQAQVQQLQAQIQNGSGAKNPLSNFDISKGVNNILNAVGKARTHMANWQFFKNSIGSLGQFFMGH